MSQLSEALDNAADVLAADYKERYGEDPPKLPEALRPEKPSPPWQYVPLVPLVISVAGAIFCLYYFDTFGVRARFAEVDRLQGEMAAKDKQFAKMGETVRNLGDQIEKLGDGTKSNVVAVEGAAKRIESLEKELEAASKKLASAEEKLKAGDEQLTSVKSDLLAAQNSLALMKKELRSGDTYVLEGLMEFPVATTAEQVTLRLPDYKTKRIIKVTKETRWLEADVEKNPGAIKGGFRVIATVRGGVLVQVDIGRLYSGKKE